MPRRRSYDVAAVSALFDGQDNVASHAQLQALGVPLSTVVQRIGPNGPWQRALPGIVLCHRGTPTRRELVRAALLYAGEPSMITGAAALRVHAVRAAAKCGPGVQVVIPNERRRQGHGYVTVERCRSLPSAAEIGGIPTVPLAKAVVDACRRLEQLDVVREVVAEVVQTGKLSVAQLSEAVRVAARQRTALTNLVLKEMAAGVRSVAEARGRELITALPIIQPEWNVTLERPDGTFLARPDAYWEELAAALEIDSMRWHLSPAAYKRTQHRQRQLVSRAGILLLPVAPADILDAPKQFQADVRGLVLQAQRRTPADGLVVVRRHP